MKTNPSDEWTLEGSREIFHRFMTVTQDSYRTSDGLKYDFDILHTADAATVLALTPDGKAVTIRQFRPGPKKMCYEMPGGYIDSGEDPALAAARELAEETGYTGDAPEYVGTMMTNPYSTCNLIVYLIRNAQKTSFQHLDSSERMTVHVIDITELERHIDGGTVTHTGAVLLALKMYQKKSLMGL